MEIANPPSLADLDERLKRIPYRGKMVTVKMNGSRIRDLFPIGSRVWFEYHCEESHQSADAELWYRSHQEVEVLTVNDGGEPPVCTTFLQRAEIGMPMCYSIRFDDGFEGTAMEDELMVTRDQFWRPDPPRKSA